MRANLDIRAAVEKAGLKLWEVAYAYGLSDGNFSRMLRHELQCEKKEKLFAIIEDLTHERAKEGKAS
jgi:lambda repressor-like predicted transcriptional regulator